MFLGWQLHFNEMFMAWQLFIKKCFVIIITKIQHSRLQRFTVTFEYKLLNC
jgi:hypothetical protein